MLCAAVVGWGPVAAKDARGADPVAAPDPDEPWILLRWDLQEAILAEPSTIRRGAGNSIELTYLRVGRDFAPVRLWRMRLDCPRGSGTLISHTQYDDQWRPSGPGPVPPDTVVRRDALSLSRLACPMRMDVPQALPRLPLSLARQAFSRGDTRPPSTDLNYAYGLSLEDIGEPGGADAAQIEPESVRRRVLNADRTPFTSVGRLAIGLPDGRQGACSAFLVGNDRTLLTSSHCFVDGASYRFEMPNGVTLAARPWARGAATYNGAFPPDLVSRPSALWEDWMVLDLERPSGGEPLLIPDEAFFSRLSELTSQVPVLHVVGYPGDVDNGRTLVWSRGCGLELSRVAHQGARLAMTNCRAYGGNSGGPVLLWLGPYRFVPVGLLMGSSATRQTVDGQGEAVIVFGGPAFVRAREKVERECAQPGLRIAFESCGRRLQAASRPTPGTATGPGTTPSRSSLRDSYDEAVAAHRRAEAAYAEQLRIHETQTAAADAARTDYERRMARWRACLAGDRASCD